MTSEGGIRVGIETAAETVARARVETLRGADASRLLAGVPLDEATRRVAMLFPVCGMAHGVALSRAIDDALGRDRGGTTDVVREAVCLGETAWSNVWQLGLTWREAAGLTPDVDRLARARGASARLSRALGHPLAAGTAPPGVTSAWTEALDAATELARIVHDLTDRSSPLERAIEDGGSASFAADAQDCAPAPTTSDLTAFGRTSAHPLVEAVVSAHGPGLLARAVARRVCALEDVERLLRLLERPAAERPSSYSGPGVAGRGVGFARTARGPLHYEVVADTESLKACSVTSPTDVTFGERGLLARILEGSAVSPTLERDARWLVLTLDPCLPWTLELRDA
jgi:hypothetical protein